MRFVFHISYDGSPYFGWQRQPDRATVQQVVEETMAKIAKTKIHCQGCGRTDTGVHASQYFFHADLDFTPDHQFLEILNFNLPDTIAVFDYFPVPDRFHAQYHAISRKYQYFIHRGKDAFFAQKSLWYPSKPDWKLIKDALSLLPGQHDFAAFCLTPEKHHTTVCEIHDASLTSWGEDRYYFSFKANRFLRGMVRILVGNLVELGKGRLSTETFEHHLMTGQKLRFHNIAPPQGLYLSKVEYPDKDIKRLGWMPGDNKP